MPPFQTSSALIARADLSIGECIKLMQKNNVGSLLIISDNTTQQLVGIFTERDLLRTVELIKTGNYWEKPVRTVMSHPVKVLPLNKIHRAADLMIKNGFRHLPIVDSDAKSKFKVVGMLSMRDIVKDLAERAATQSSKNLSMTRSTKVKQPTVGIVTLDPSILSMLERLLETELIETKHFTLEQVLEPSRDLDTVVIDLDQLETSQWLSALKLVNRKSTAPFTVVIFDPTRYTKRTLAVLDKLSGARRFAAFSKPIAMTALVQKIRAATR